MYGVQPQPQPRPRQPGTVTTVVVIVAVKAGLMIIAVGGLLLGLGIGGLHGDFGDIEAWMVATVLVGAPVAAGLLVVAVKVAKGREWARVTAIVVESLSLPGALWGVVTVREQAIVLVLSMAGSIAVICCATQRTAVQYCRKR